MFYINNVLVVCVGGYYGKFCNKLCFFGKFGDKCGGSCFLNCIEEYCDFFKGCINIKKEIKIILLDMGE